ncbi:ArgE/DapE family deacylase [Lactiplantibacillus dongliensis]|uniref:Probable succinyl-diaminopimelate desuccinylase n=1 Tax=Lactiplantibacillus dongliensis TaxID=2559919 RepID=A0ABW1R249_9LACO|nr:ArgE/DapE family deacylase [Lactiplantibacillus dongliensis]
MKDTEKISLLSRLVAMNTVNRNEIEPAKYLKQLFDDAGIKCEVLPVGEDRANLIAEIDSGSPILAISGHFDVVAADAKEWATDPFTLTEKDGQLFGRGANDMKSGLAALTIAMLELKAQQVPINGTIRLMVTFGEEVGELGAKMLYDAGYMQGVNALMIAEPSGYRICYGQAGTIDIDLESIGKNAHSSMPALGSNAVDHLIRVLYTIKAKVMARAAGLHNAVLNTDTLFNIDVFNGGEQVNTIPNHALAKINLRTIPEVSNAEILQIFHDVIDADAAKYGSQINMHVEMDLNPVVGDPQSKMLQLIQRVAKPYLLNAKFSASDQQQNQIVTKMLGRELPAGTIPALGAPGGTDARRLLVDQPLGFDYTVFGPGNFTSHQPNEYVSKSMYLDFIKMYEELFPAYFNEA